MLTFPTVESIVYVLERLPKDEIDQYLSATGADYYNPQDFAKRIIRSTGELSFLLTAQDGTALCIGGYIEAGPGRWETWMLATEEAWKHHSISLTKYAKRTMRELLKSDRCHRIECFSARARNNAHVWYKEALGMEEESTLRNWYADGSDAVCFVKLKD